MGPPRDSEWCWQHRPQGELTQPLHAKIISPSQELVKALGAPQADVFLLAGIADLIEGGMDGDRWLAVHNLPKHLPVFLAHGTLQRSFLAYKLPYTLTRVATVPCIGFRVGPLLPSVFSFFFVGSFTEGEVNLLPKRETEELMALRFDFLLMEPSPVTTVLILQKDTVLHLSEFLAAETLWRLSHINLLHV